MSDRLTTETPGERHDDVAYANTDRELWREGDPESGMSYYEPSIHVTEQGGIGINVGGTVYVKTLREWHALAAARSAAETPSQQDAQTVLRDAAELLAQTIYNVPGWTGPDVWWKERADDIIARAALAAAADTTTNEREHAVKPRILDLFCGAGGAAMGYHRAGFDVVGVDIKPQPNFPFEFVQADALVFLRNGMHGWPLSIWARGFDAIHASPPCQAFTSARVIHGNEHPDLLTPCRELLQATGLPWVIENVPGAPMRKDLVLCGTQFDGLEDKAGQLVRHRWFEFSDPHIAPALVHPCRHDRPTISVFGHGGHIYHGVAQWRTVMGIDWMTRDELAQAIPPAYTEFIGRHLIAHIGARVG